MSHDLYALMLLVLQNLFSDVVVLKRIKYGTLQHSAAAAAAVTAAFKCVCYSRILLTNIKLINVNIVYLIQNAKQTTKAISIRCTLPYMYSCEHTRRILPFGKHVFNFVF